MTKQELWELMKNKSDELEDFKCKNCRIHINNEEHISFTTYEHYDIVADEYWDFVEFICKNCFLN